MRSFQKLKRYPTHENICLFVEELIYSQNDRYLSIIQDNSGCKLEIRETKYGSELSYTLKNIIENSPIVSTFIDDYRDELIEGLYKILR